MSLERTCDKSVRRLSFQLFACVWQISMCSGDVCTYYTLDSEKQSWTSHAFICTFGCCGNYTVRYCCTSPIVVVSGGLGGILLVIGVTVLAILCVKFKNRQLNGTRTAPHRRTVIIPPRIDRPSQVSSCVTSQRRSNSLCTRIGDVRQPVAGSARRDITRTERIADGRARIPPGEPPPPYTERGSPVVLHLPGASIET